MNSADGPEQPIASRGPRAGPSLQASTRYPPAGPRGHVHRRRDADRRPVRRASEQRLKSAAARSRDAGRRAPTMRRRRRRCAASARPGGRASATCRADFRPRGAGAADRFDPGRSAPGSSPSRGPPSASADRRRRRLTTTRRVGQRSTTAAILADRCRAVARIRPLVTAAPSRWAPRSTAPSSPSPTGRSSSSSSRSSRSTSWRWGCRSSAAHSWWPCCSARTSARSSAEGAATTADLVIGVALDARRSRCRRFSPRSGIVAFGGVIVMYRRQGRARWRCSSQGDRPPVTFHRDADRHRGDRRAAQAFSLGAVCWRRQRFGRRPRALAGVARRRVSHDRGRGYVAGPLRLPLALADRLGTGVAAARRDRDERQRCRNHGGRISPTICCA